MSNTIEIKFISDFVCPFCYVARISLLKAASNYDVAIEWLPYELTPTSKPQVDVFHNPAKKMNYRKHLAPLCKNLSIDMKLPPKVTPRPYSRLAIEGLFYAKEYGKDFEYTSKVFDAYYLEELNIGNIEILTAIAEEIGLSKEDFKASLLEEKYKEIVEKTEQHVIEEFHPQSFPTIIINDTVRLDGVNYTVEEFTEILEQASKQTEQKVVAGFGCSPNGCQF